MAKVILAFLILFILFFMGIKLAQNMTGKEALVLTKIIGYSIICTTLSLAVLISIVIIF